MIRRVFTSAVSSLVLGIVVFLGGFTLAVIKLKFVDAPIEARQIANRCFGVAWPLSAYYFLVAMVLYKK